MPEEARKKFSTWLSEIVDNDTLLTSTIFGGSNGTNSAAAFTVAALLTYLNANIQLPSTSKVTGLVTALAAKENVFYATLQTAGDTETNLFTVALAEGETINLWGRLLGTRADFLHVLGGSFDQITARRAVGGNITLVGSPITNTNADSASYDADVDIATQSLRVRVTGVAATTYNWKAEYNYIKSGA